MNYSGGKRSRSISIYDAMPTMNMYGNRTLARKAIRRRMRRVGPKRGINARVSTFVRVGTELVISSPVTANGAPTVNGASGGAGGLSVGAFTSSYLINNGYFFGGMYFRLSDVVNSSEITGLFDNYRIKNVKLKFFFSYAGGPATVASNNLQQPLLTIAPDFDDSTPPSGSTGKAELLQNGYVRQKRLGTDTFTMTVQPRWQGAVASSPTGTATGNLLMGDGRGWLDCQNGSAVPHHGVKFCIDDICGAAGVSGSGLWTLTVVPYYTIEAKSLI